MNELSNKIYDMKTITVNETGSGMDKILKDIYKMVDENEHSLKEAYELDKEYSKRKEEFKVKFILDAIEEVIDYKFVESKVFESIDGKRVLGIKQNLGVIGVFYDGDILLTLDIICKALKTNNAVIFNVDISKNVGTNNLIVKMVKEILKNNGKPSNLVEINFADNDNLLLEDLDLIIVNGSRGKRNGFREVAKCRTLESGFGYSEIYIEDVTNEAFIKEIIEKEDNDINIYIKNDCKIDISGIYVTDINEAIERINKNGASYSSAIFTNDEKNAREYIKKVKSKYTFVNASPTLARISDIDIKEFYYEKTCIV